MLPKPGFHFARMSTIVAAMLNDTASRESTEASLRKRLFVSPAIVGSPLVCASGRNRNSVKRIQSLSTASNSVCLRLSAAPWAMHPCHFIDANRHDVVFAEHSNGRRRLVGPTRSVEHDAGIVARDFRRDRRHVARLHLAGLRYGNIGCIARATGGASYSSELFCAIDDAFSVHQPNGTITIVNTTMQSLFVGVIIIARLLVGVSEFRPSQGLRRVRSIFFEVPWSRLRSDRTRNLLPSLCHWS